MTEEQSVISTEDGAVTTIVHLSDDEATVLAKEVLADKARGYYPAAVALAKVVLGQRARIRVASILHQSLKETQARCTELIDEARALKRELVGARLWMNRFARETEEHARTQLTLASVRQDRDQALADLVMLRERARDVVHQWDGYQSLFDVGTTAVEDAIKPLRELVPQ